MRQQQQPESPSFFSCLQDKKTKNKTENVNSVIQIRMEKSATNWPESP